MRLKRAAQNISVCSLWLLALSGTGCYIVPAANAELRAEAERHSAGAFTSPPAKRFLVTAEIFRSNAEAIIARVSDGRTMRPGQVIEFTATIPPRAGDAEITELLLWPDRPGRITLPAPLSHLKLVFRIAGLSVRQPTDGPTARGWRVTYRVSDQKSAPRSVTLPAGARLWFAYQSEATDKKKSWALAIRVERIGSANKRK